MHRPHSPGRFWSRPRALVRKGPGPIEDWPCRFSNTAALQGPGFSYGTDPGQVLKRLGRHFWRAQGMARRAFAAPAPDAAP